MFFEEKVIDSISKGNIVWLINSEDNSYKEYKVTETQDFFITLETLENEVIEAHIVMVLGFEEDNPMIFGVNSGNVRVANGFIYPRGLTINEYNN